MLSTDVEKDAEDVRDAGGRKEWGGPLLNRFGAYDPVLSHYDGQEWRRSDLARYISLGEGQISPDTAAELIVMRRTDRVRSQLTLKGLLAGASREEIEEMFAINPDGVNEYVSLRFAGASHASAVRESMHIHVHRFGPGELLSDFCPVLRTGTRTVRYTCACGHTEAYSERRNYSGD